jgi:hypothetical protein
MNYSAVLKLDRVEALLRLINPLYCWTNVRGGGITYANGIGGEGGKAELTIVDAPLNE